MNDYIKLLGFKGKDKITGFSGVITSISFDLYGCVQLVIQPGLDKDGKQKEGHWFDAKRVEVTSTKPVMKNPFVPLIKAGKERGAAEKPRQPSTVAR